MNPVVIGVLAWFAASLVVAGFASTFMRHATDPEPCSVDPELAEAVKQALIAEVERQERLASTGELQAIDIDLYDPDDFGSWEREVSQ